MTGIFLRSGDQPARTRFEYWQDAITRFAYPVRIASKPLPPQDHRLWSIEAGGLKVTSLFAPGECYAVRDAALVRRDGRSSFVIATLLAGNALVRQGDRQAELCPADTVVIDLAKPSTWIGKQTHVVLLEVPRSVIPHATDRVELLAGVGIDGRRGAGAMASEVVRHLPDRLSEVESGLWPQFGSAVVDLLSVALATELQQLGSTPAEPLRTASYRAISSYIEEHLPDPALSPASIAARHHISLRQLYKLFEHQQLSVAAWIRIRRLECCRRDLHNPALLHKPIGSVAAMWGFTNPAHFSRAFRAAFGISPSGYREANRLQPVNGESLNGEPVNGESLNGEPDWQSDRELDRETLCELARPRQGPAF